MNTAGLALCVDGGSATLCVAVVDGNGVRAEEQGPSSVQHGVALLDLVPRVMAAAGVTPPQLDAIVVALGPGSFTGLRGVLAACKGLALGWNKPLWGAPTLHALARSSGAAPGAVVLAALDARKQEVFAGAWRLGVTAGDDEVVMDTRVEPVNMVADVVRAWAPVVCAGDALLRMPDALRPVAAVSGHHDLAYPSMRALHACARPVDLAGVEPLYVRRSYVETNNAARTAPPRGTP